MTTNALSYLDQCKADISPETKKSLDRKETLWKVAIAVTAVASVILVCGAFIALNVCVASPYVLPCAGLAMYACFMPIAESGINQLLEFQKQNSNDQDQCREIASNFTLLSNKTAEETSLALRKKGVIASPEDAVKMRPILAKLKYFNHYAKIHLKIAKEDFEMAEKLATENPKSNRIAIIKKRAWALDTENQALKLKMQAAFAYAVLHKGDTQHSLETIGETTAAVDTMMDMPFFLFKNSLLAPITQTQVRGLTVAGLGNRLLEAIHL